MSSNFTYKNEYGFSWRLVYYLDSSVQTFFSSEEEAKNCNVKGRFSILDSIPKIKGQTTYTFLLEYPVEYKGKYIIWQQSKSPYDDIEVSGVNSATGFSLLKNTIGTTFNGLVRTAFADQSAKEKVTLIDGNPGTSYWYYSIGMYKATKYWTAVPGPYDKTSVTVTALWVRAPDILYQRTNKRCPNRLKLLNINNIS